ncbi:MAG: DUF6356 family protein [Pseudomonadota bacterium]
MRHLRAYFTEHPESVGESYFEHMATAFSFGSRMLYAGLACLMHGLLPFLFTKTGSAMISRLHDEMVAHRVKPKNAARAAAATGAAE